MTRNTPAAFGPGYSTHMKRTYTHRVVYARTNEANGTYEGGLCSEHYTEAAANKAASTYTYRSNSKDPGQFRVEPIVTCNTPAAHGAV